MTSRAITGKVDETSGQFEFKGDDGSDVDVTTLSQLEMFDIFYRDDEVNGVVPVLAEAIRYKGFDPIELRRELSDKGLLFKDLLVILTALAISGNNPNRLTDRAKVRNVEVGMRAAEILRKYEIQRTKTQGGLITLARVGIAYIGIYAQLRKYLVSTGMITKQFSTPLEAVFQDPNMGAVAIIHGQEDSYREYEGRISAALRSASARTTRADWLEIACRGLSSDVLSCQVLSGFTPGGPPMSPSAMAPLFAEYNTGNSRNQPVAIPALRTTSILLEAAVEVAEPSRRK